jgi:hypothetical protein
VSDVVKAKGWDSPAAAVLSYANLETAFGADKAGRTILAPKDENDAEGWNAVYGRLGRPETPDGYELAVSEGSDGAYLKDMLPAFHELGLTKRQAQALVERNNAVLAKLGESDDLAFKAKSEADYAALQNEWGQAATTNEELARRAVAQFGSKAGLDADGLQALEAAIGTGAMLKLFHAIGASFAEGTFKSGDGVQGGGVLTPDRAKAEIARKNADPEFLSRYLHDDPKVRASAMAEMESLHIAAFPEISEEDQPRRRA